MGIVFAVVLGALAAGESATAEQVRDAVTRSLAGTVQSRLPGEEAAAKGDDKTTWRKRRVGGATPDAPARRREIDGPALGGLGGIGGVLMWAVVAVAAGLLIAWGVREISGYAGDPAPEPDTPPTAEDAHAVVEQPLSDADELAREGRFAEAIHTLLLRTLRELAARTRTPLPRSLTSREILARVSLVAAARAALGVLITTAELCHFGGATPGADDYARCREQFHVFAAAYQGELGASA